MHLYMGMYDMGMENANGATSQSTLAPRRSTIRHRCASVSIMHRRTSPPDSSTQRQLSQRQIQLPGHTPWQSILFILLPLIFLSSLTIPSFLPIPYSSSPSPAIPLRFVSAATTNLIRVSNSVPTEYVYSGFLFNFYFDVAPAPANGPLGLTVACSSGSPMSYTVTWPQGNDQRLTVTYAPPNMPPIGTGSLTGGGSYGKGQIGCSFTPSLGDYAVSPPYLVMTWSQPASLSANPSNLSSLYAEAEYDIHIKPDALPVKALTLSCAATSSTGVTLPSSELSWPIGNDTARIFPLRTPSIDKATSVTIVCTMQTPLSNFQSPLILTYTIAPHPVHVTQLNKNVYGSAVTPAFRIWLDPGIAGAGFTLEWKCNAGNLMTEETGSPSSQTDVSLGDGTSSIILYYAPPSPFPSQDNTWSGLIGSNAVILANHSACDFQLPGGSTGTYQYSATRYIFAFAGPQQSFAWLDPSPPPIIDGDTQPNWYSANIQPLRAPTSGTVTLTCTVDVGKFSSSNAATQSLEWLVGQQNYPLTLDYMAPTPIGTLRAATIQCKSSSTEFNHPPPLIIPMREQAYILQTSPYVLGKNTSIVISFQYPATNTSVHAACSNGTLDATTITTTEELGPNTFRSLTFNLHLPAIMPDTHYWEFGKTYVSAGFVLCSIWLDPRYPAAQDLAISNPSLSFKLQTPYPFYLTRAPMPAYLGDTTIIQVQPGVPPIFAVKFGTCACSGGGSVHNIPIWAASMKIPQNLTYQAPASMPGVMSDSCTCSIVDAPGDDPYDGSIIFQTSFQFNVPLKYKTMTIQPVNDPIGIVWDGQEVGVPIQVEFAQLPAHILSITLGEYGGASMPFNPATLPVTDPHASTLGPFYLYPPARTTSYVFKVGIIFLSGASKSEYMYSSTFLDISVSTRERLHWNVPTSIWPGETKTLTVTRSSLLDQQLNIPVNCTGCTILGGVDGLQFPPYVQLAYVSIKAEDVKTTEAITIYVPESRPMSGAGALGVVSPGNVSIPINDPAVWNDVNWPTLMPLGSSHIAYLGPTEIPFVPLTLKCQCDGGAVITPSEFTFLAPYMGTFNITAPISMPTTGDRRSFNVTCVTTGDAAPQFISPPQFHVSLLAAVIVKPILPILSGMTFHAAVALTARPLTNLTLNYTFQYGGTGSGQLIFRHDDASLSQIITGEAVSYPPDYPTPQPVNLTLTLTGGDVASFEVVPANFPPTVLRIPIYLHHNLPSADADRFYCIPGQGLNVSLDIPKTSNQPRLGNLTARFTLTQGLHYEWDSSHDWHTVAYPLPDDIDTAFMPIVVSYATQSLSSSDACAWVNSQGDGWSSSLTIKLVLDGPGALQFDPQPLVIKVMKQDRYVFNPPLSTELYCQSTNTFTIVPTASHPPPLVVTQFDPPTWLQLDPDTPLNFSQYHVNFRIVVPWYACGPTFPDPKVTLQLDTKVATRQWSSPNPTPVVIPVHAWPINILGVPLEQMSGTNLTLQVQLADPARFNLNVTWNMTGGFSTDNVTQGILEFLPGNVTLPILVFAPTLVNDSSQTLTISFNVSGHIPLRFAIPEPVSWQIVPPPVSSSSSSSSSSSTGASSSSSSSTGSSTDSSSGSDSDSSDSSTAATSSDSSSGSSSTSTGSDSGDGSGTNADSSNSTGVAEPPVETVAPGDVDSVLNPPVTVEIGVDACSLQPNFCLNHGECQATAVGGSSSDASGQSMQLQCQCVSGFFGPHCEVAILSCENGCATTWTGNDTLQLIGIGLGYVDHLVVGALELDVKRLSPISRSSNTAKREIKVRSKKDPTGWEPFVMEDYDQFDVIQFTAPSMQAIMESRETTSSNVNRNDGKSAMQLMDMDDVQQPFSVEMDSLPMTDMSSFTPLSHLALSFASSSVTPTYESLYAYAHFTSNSTSSIVEVPYRSASIYYAVSTCGKNEFQDGYGGCKQCPSGCNCPGGGRCWPKPGYWSYSQNSLPVACDVADHCPGIDPTEAMSETSNGEAPDTQVCVAGYTGAGCKSCADGYYELSSRCYSCGDSTDQSAQFAALVLGAVAVTAGLAASVAIFDAPWLVEIVECFLALQQVSELGAQGSKDIPGDAGRGLATFFSFISIVNFDLQILQPGCSVPSFTFLSLFWFTIALIIFSWFAFMAACLLRFAWRKAIERKNGHGMSDEERDAMQQRALQAARKDPAHAALQRNLFYIPPREDLSRRVTHATLILLSIFYLKLTSLQLKLFDCVMAPDPQTALAPIPGDESLYLQADLQTKCYTGAHLLTVIFALLLFVFYTFGFPFVCFILLMRAFADRSFPGIIGRFYSDYKLFRPKQSRKEERQQATRDMRAGEQRRQQRTIGGNESRYIANDGADTPDGETATPTGDTTMKVMKDPVKSDAFAAEKDAAVENNKSVESVLALLYIEHKRLSIYGFFYYEIRYDTFPFRLIYFPLNFFFAVFTIYIHSTMPQLFLLALVFAVESLAACWLVPHTSWKENAKAISLPIATMTQSIVMIAAQTGGSRSPYFITALIIAILLIFILAGRHGIVRALNKWCGLHLADGGKGGKDGRTKGAFSPQARALAAAARAAVVQRAAATGTTMEDDFGDDIDMDDGDVVPLGDDNGRDAVNHRRGISAALAAYDDDDDGDPVSRTSYSRSSVVPAPTRSLLQNASAECSDELALETQTATTKRIATHQSDAKGQGQGQGSGTLPGAPDDSHMPSPSGELDQSTSTSQSTPSGSPTGSSRDLTQTQRRPAYHTGVVRAGLDSDLAGLGMDAVFEEMAAAREPNQIQRLKATLQTGGMGRLRRASIQQQMPPQSGQIHAGSSNSAMISAPRSLADAAIAVTQQSQSPTVRSSPPMSPLPSGSPSGVPPRSPLAPPSAPRRVGRLPTLMAPLTLTSQHRRKPTRQLLSQSVTSLLATVGLDEEQRTRTRPRTRTQQTQAREALSPLSPEIASPSAAVLQTSPSPSASPAASPHGPTNALMNALMAGRTAQDADRMNESSSAAAAAPVGSSSSLSVSSRSHSRPGLVRATSRSLRRRSDRRSLRSDGTEAPHQAQTNAETSVRSEHGGGSRPSTSESTTHAPTTS